MIIPRVQPFRTTAKGLVACWPAFEGAGPILRDVSGYGNDGIFASALPVWTGNTPGVPAPRGAISFPGFSPTGYVGTSLGYPNNPFVNQISCTTWALTAQDTTTLAVLGCNNYTVDGFDIDAMTIFLVAPSTFWARVQTGAATLANWQTLSGGNWTMNVWHHIGVTYNGAVMTLFIDGVPLTSGALTGNVTAPDLPWRIGCRGNTSAEGANNYAWVGMIGETRFYNRALAPSEIWDIYTGNG